MRAPWLLGILASVACGGDAAAPGDPLGPAADLVIVAHQGDDLWFLQSDVSDAVARGTGVTTVYVTAGEDEDGAAAAAARYDGARAAYAAIAGASVTSWSCGAIAVAGHAVQHCRLDAANISLIFLGVPDGGKDGSAENSLLHLWESRVAKLPAIGQAATYDQRGLIATLSEIIDTAAPTTLRTLEIASTHGDDHSDHMITGALAVLAAATAARIPDLISYRGDNISSEPANLAPAVVDHSADIASRYAACTTGCGRCGEGCPLDRLDAVELGWLARRYPIGMRRTADGLLRFADGCVTVNASGANAAIIDCQAAPSWHLDDDGTLRASTGLCIHAIFTGEIVAGACSGADPGGRFFLDDEGHLWSGVVPAPEANMAFAHLDCVISAGGRPRAALCGAARAPTVAFSN